MDDVSLLMLLYSNETLTYLVDWILCCHSHLRRLSHVQYVSKYTARTTIIPPFPNAQGVTTAYEMFPEWPSWMTKQLHVTFVTSHSPEEVFTFYRSIVRKEGEWDSASEADRTMLPMVLFKFTA